MKTITNSICRTAVFLAFNIIVLVVADNRTFAQCVTSSAPVYSNTCTSDYYTSITASGTGVASTIFLTGSSCTGTTYFNDFASQGITAPAGTVVSMNINRAATYAGYLSVYIDWDNDGTYETTELAGSMISLPVTTLSAVYNFTIPTTGIVTGTNLHLRVMLSELATGAPCTANWGQTADFYLNVTCPPTTVSISPFSGSLCAGGAAVTITASGAGTGGTYTWSPATGLSATSGAAVTAAPTATTVYTVTGITALGCSNTSAITITINPSPADTIKATDVLTFCPGDSVTLWVPGGDSYQWYKGTTAIPGATDSAYRDTSSGSYKVVVTNILGCSTTATPVTVTVRALVPAVTFDGRSFHTGNYYLTYQWYENGLAISGATHDSVIAHTNGSYTVKVADTTGCTGTSAIYVLTHVAVTNVSGRQEIEIYPNPTSGILQIEAPEKVDATISGADSKVILTQKDATEINISVLPAGIYFIELDDKSGQKLTVQKIIKN